MTYVGAGEDRWLAESGGAQWIASAMIAVINPKTVNQDKVEISSSALALIETQRQWINNSSLVEQRCLREPRMKIGRAHV